jgi:predicted HicB family RNase H-like nuclease
MAGKEPVAWVQLATRIPKSLHREIKLHCVTIGTSVMAFVTRAIEEKLARSRRVQTKRRRGKA